MSIFEYNGAAICAMAGDKCVAIGSDLRLGVQFKHNMYKLREERNIRPTTFGHLVSGTLYEKRFGPYFCSPVIAGLEDDGTPYLCGMDTIGAMETAEDFMV